MNLPKTDQPQKYVGLYVIDFGQQCGIGYTAEEVAQLLESEEFADIKVYKIHRAKPDGTMDLAGVPRDKFFMESGTFFHCRDESGARQDFQSLCKWSDSQPSPCRAQLHLARDKDQQLLIGLIYPAEYEQEIGAWLTDSGFRGTGPVDAGPSQLQRYYQGDYDLLEQRQLWPQESLQMRNREELLAHLKVAFQR